MKRRHLAKYLNNELQLFLLDKYLLWIVIRDLIQGLEMKNELLHQQKAQISLEYSILVLIW